MQETQETQILSLHGEDPLEEEMTTCFSILAWEIPWTKEPSKLQSMRAQRVGHDWTCVKTDDSSVQVSRSVMSDSLRPHGLQHARLPCPSPTPGAYSNSYSSSRWCHPTISSSVVPFSSCLQSLPASGSFQMKQLFASAGQSIGVSASTSVLPMNTQDWSPLGWTGWISLQSKGLSRVFSKTHSSKTSILQNSTFFIVHLSHPYMTTGKTTALTSWTFVGKVMSLLFNRLSRLVAFFQGAGIF